MVSLPSWIPTTDRLSPQRVKGAAALVAAVFLGMVVMSLMQKRQAEQTPAEPPLPPIYEVSGEGNGFQQLQLKTSWAGEDRTPKSPPPPKPQPPPLPPMAAMFPPQAPQVASLAPVAPAPAPSPFVPQVVAQTPAPAAPAGQSPAVKQGTVQPVQPPPEKKVPRYLFHDKAAVGTSPFDKDGDKTREARAQEKRGQVIKPATWETPVDTRRVWYMSQAITGQLVEKVVSDIAGPFTIRVTRDLPDKQLLGGILVPQHSLIVAEQASKPDFGQGRLQVNVKQIELPDGSILSAKAGIGDQFGAIGVPGDVNNHYARILFGATMTALLSVGARLPAGNTEGFFPTMGQQFSANAAQSVAQSGAEILRRTLPTNPTITLEAGTPVTIRPGENISLLSGPKVVR